MLSAAVLIAASMVAGQAESDEQLSPGQEKMQELSFLIGTWQNVKKPDETSVYSWINNKSYIMCVAGEYREIIGWDLQHERIASWCFGTDGGQGKGIWKRDGNDWQQIIRGFLNRWGRPMKTIAVNVEAPDDDTLRFVSVNTDANGQPVYQANFRRVSTEGDDETGDVAIDSAAEVDDGDE